MVEGEVKTRRRLSAEVRRAMIRDAAIALFAAQGYARTTTKEIAQAAGVSEGTIFKYFPTKRDLLLAFFHAELFQPLTVIFNVQEPVDDFQVLRAFIADRFALWHRHRHLMRVIFGEAAFDPAMVEQLNRITAPALEIIQGYFIRRIRAGAFRDLDPAVAARSLMSMILFYFFRWELMDQSDASLDSVIEQLTGLVLYGIAGQPPRESQP